MPVTISAVRVYAPGSVVDGDVTSVPGAATAAAAGPAVAGVRVASVTAVPGAVTSAAAAPVVDDGTGFADGREVTTSNVGYVPTGVSLTTYTGPMTITSNGTTIDSKQINGNLTIDADNVTVKRSLIVAGPGGENRDSGLVIETGTTGTLIEDVELRSTTGNGGDGYAAAQDRAVCYYGSGATIRRCYIHGTRRFIALPSGGTYLTVEDTYIGDNVNTSEGHTSGIGAWGGASYFTLRRCRFRGPMDDFASGCVQCYPEGSANHHWTIEKNHLSTGGGALMTFGYTPSAGESPNHHITVQDNYFGDATYDNTWVAWNQVASNGTKIREAFTLPDGSNVWGNNREYVSGDLIGQPT